jgi:hypothetical protein
MSLNSGQGNWVFMKIDRIVKKIILEIKLFKKWFLEKASGCLGCQ